MIRIRYIITALCFAVVMAGCSKDEEGAKLPPLAKSRTILVYLGMDNSLHEYGLENIKAMVEGATRRNIGNNNLIIFHDPKLDNPLLLRIYADPKTGMGRKDTLEIYSDDPSSAHAATLGKIINSTKSHAPADSYGLIFGSHATGWLPGTKNSDTWWRSSYGGEIAPMSVIEDQGVFMELADFAATLPDEMFDFIIFDECLMAGIEVVWALRNKADQIVASSAEILSEGMPYKEIMRSMFEATPVLGKGGVSEIYYNHYMSDIWMKSATISLIDCTQVDEDFATVMSDIIAAGEAKLAAMKPVMSRIQYYDRFNKHLFYDIMGFAEALCDEGDINLALLKAKMERIVTYKQITPYVMSMAKDPLLYSGMTAYIPFPEYSVLTEKYKNTEWYKRVAAGTPVPTGTPVSSDTPN